MAEPGTVVIADRTRQLSVACSTASTSAGGPSRAFSEPLRAWRVIGRSRAEGRFEARQAGAPMPLVGRSASSPGCSTSGKERSDGAGQVVPVGRRTRDRQVAPRARTGRPAAVGDACSIHCRCSPLHMSSPFYPVIEQIERAAGFAHDDPADRRLDKLEDLLAHRLDRCLRGGTAVRRAAVTPGGSAIPSGTLAPQTQRERTLAALLGQLEGLAGSAADAGGVRGRTLERPDLARAAGPDSRAAADRCPVLMIVSARPSSRPPGPAPITPRR